MSQALILIDVQNDDFEGGGFPLWHAEEALSRIEAAAQRATAQGIPVVLVQHVADPAQGLSPFFNEGTEGGSEDPPAGVGRRAGSHRGEEGLRR